MITQFNRDENDPIAYGSDEHWSEEKMPHIGTKANDAGTSATTQRHNEKERKKETFLMRDLLMYAQSEELKRSGIFTHSCV